MDAEVHQVLVSASAHDAITTQAFEIQALLGGWPRARIFAARIDPRVEDRVEHLDTYATLPSARRGHNVLVFHASIGEPGLRAFLESRPEPLVLVYHNVTPPQFFAPYDLRFARLLELGRQDVAALRDRVTLALAVSEFNAAELRQMGYGSVGVAPLIIDLARLPEPRPEPVPGPGGDSSEPLLLFVGQLLPHKRVDLLVMAYEVLVRYLEPAAHLVLAGPVRSDRYANSVLRLIRELNLRRVQVTGPVDDGRLVELFRRASVFVTMSEHEGVGIPLVEAMGFGVPVVARACAGIPDTVGDAALLLDPGDGPAVVAEAVAEVLANPDLRRYLSARGRERMTRFDPAEARRTFLAHLESVAGR